MLGHYSDWHKELQEKNGCLPPLLFLVGKTRSDIIPKTLMSFDLPKKEQIIVDEVEVYETGVMESFEDEFTRYLDATKDNKRRWVVIFSPTGCEAALRALGWLDPVTKKATHPEGCRRTYIASIGPTTRDYLINQFGYQPDVCAEKPSPEGVGDAIEAFMANL